MRWWSHRGVRRAGGGADRAASTAFDGADDRVDRRAKPEPADRFDEARAGAFAGRGKAQRDARTAGSKLRQSQTIPRRRIARIAYTRRGDGDDAGGVIATPSRRRGVPRD